MSMVHLRFLLLPVFGIDKEPKIKRKDFYFLIFFHIFIVRYSRNSVSYEPYKRSIDGKKGIKTDLAGQEARQEFQRS